MCFGSRMCLLRTSHVKKNVTVFAEDIYIFILLLYLLKK